MSEFRVDTDKITSLADLLESQASKIEAKQRAAEEVSRNLAGVGQSENMIKSAIRMAGNRVNEEATTATRMAKALREIAQAYRKAERNIIDNLRLNPNPIISGGSGGSGGNGGSGNGGNTGNGGNGGSSTQNGGNSGSNIQSSDPVSLNTGNFVLDNHDLEIPGYMPLVFRRFYNSMSGFSGMLGSDWNSCFETRFYLNSKTETEAKIFIVLEDGREEHFKTSDGVTFTPASATTAELTRTEEGNYVYTTLYEGSYYFNETGSLTRYENKRGVGYSLEYADGKVASVVKDSGEAFNFAYGENGLLEELSDNSGRTCKYSYVNGHLCNVVLPDGSEYKYSYDSLGKITKVVNPRNVDAVETEYDSMFRATHQKFADGTTNDFEYIDSENVVVMTERNGSKSMHYRNDLYQNIRNVYADGEESFEYNERGLKTKIIDKAGNVSRMQYDNRGNVTCIITPDGTKTSATYNSQNLLLTISVNGVNKVKNQYDKMGDLIASTDGLGNTTTYKYNERGQVTQTIYADGTKSSVMYDNAGNVTSEISRNGATNVYTYNELNQLVSKTDANGNVTSYTYDVMGRVLSETRPDGMSKSYVYDAWGNITKETNFDGSVISRVFNDNNRLISETDPCGNTVNFSYDSMWNLAGVTLASGAVFSYLYDVNNNLKTTVHAEGGKTEYEYDSVGNVISETDAEGNKTQFEWDGNGHLVRVTAADGTVTVYGYDGEDHLIYMKDAEGTELFREFDINGNLVSEKDNLGQVREYTYDSNGNIVKLINEKGIKTSFEYAPGLDKVSKVINTDGTSEQYIRDLKGNLVKKIDRFGNVSEFTYDNLDRIISVKSGNGSELSYGYDLMGRITSETDCYGNVTRYEYSATGKLIRVISPSGETTNYTYNSSDDLVEVLRSSQNDGTTFQTLYERNFMGQATKVTDAMGHSETYSYNKMGRLVEKVDREGYSTKYEYNCVGLLSKVLWANGREVSYQYSKLRRLNEICDWNGTTKVSYDQLGNPLEIIYPDNTSLKYGYDSRRNRNHVYYPDGKEVSYEFDELNRIKEINHNGQKYTYSYDNFGHLVMRTLPDASRIDFIYDERGNLTTETHSDSEGILDEFKYSYDEMGRKSQFGVFRRDYQDANGLYDYLYDAAGHIQTVRMNQEIIRSYSYDSFGNRTGVEEVNPLTGTASKTTYEHDERGGIIRTISGDFTEEYEYDHRGNVTKQLVNGHTEKSYSYDEMNRLSSVRTSSGSASSYLYNGLGYLVGREVSGANGTKSESYKIDYSRVYNNIIQRSVDGNATDYIWGENVVGSLADDASLGVYTTDSYGSVIRRSESGRASFVCNYDEFGNCSHNGSEDEEFFGFTGFYFDSSAGAYFAPVRLYRSKTATFDSLDRFGGDITTPETMNPYIYCMQDPLSKTDKTAYWFGIDDAIAAGLGALGGIVSTAVGDVVEGVTTGNWDFSWQEYTGAAIGGAAGGVTTLYAGPIAGAAVAGGVGKLTTEGLNYVSDPKGYDKSLLQVFGEAAFDAGVGALTAGIADVAGKGLQKLANTSVVQGWTSKLTSGNKVAQFFGNQIKNIADGTGKGWSGLAETIRKNHKLIGETPFLKNLLMNDIKNGIKGYVVDALSPVDGLLSWGGGKVTDFIKNKLGFGSVDPCAAAA